MYTQAEALELASSIYRMLADLQWHCLSKDKINYENYVADPAHALVTIANPMHDLKIALRAWGVQA